METSDELSAKFAQLDNKYKEIMDTDWWLMSIIITIELTALPLIALLVLAIIEYKDKQNDCPPVYTVDKSEPIFPEPSRETFRMISDHWSGKTQFLSPGLSLGLNWI